MTSELATRADYLCVDSLHALPTGVVTFLLTDIEGSTRLWEREPDAMRQALARHDSLVTACVRRQKGHVVKSKGEGDSVFAVFRHVRDAVTAALVVQCALAAERWPTTTPMRVRMAIHTGEIELREGDYYGPTVNRCARLRALAKGGQVLVSGVTAKLLNGQLPGGASLKDLGTHQLKDLAAPERVWQLAHPQLAVSAAPAMAAALVTAKPVQQQAYVLTDHNNRSADRLEWAAGVTYSGGRVGNDDQNLIRCYTSPEMAALLNPLNEGLRVPRLWEANVDAEPQPDEATVMCSKVTAVRQVAMPALTGIHYGRFAVACAREAYHGGMHEAEFGAWAEGWLAGHDNSGLAARELADSLEAEAHQGGINLSRPGEGMIANAARSAMHASRMGWLTGRAREEENAQAVAFAVESLRMAIRSAHLDLPAIAREVSATSNRPVSLSRPGVVLRA